MKAYATTTVVLALACGAVADDRMPLSAAFTYQGMLRQNGTPLNGVDLADIEASLYDAPSLGSQIGSPVPTSNVDFDQGRFTLLLNFGTDAFAGESRWLELRVRKPAGSGTWATLSPRQALTATPYALYALQSAGGDSLWQADPNNAGIYYNDGNVGIGTDNPVRPLDVLTSSNQIGLSHTDGTVRMSTYIDTTTGGWLGTETGHGLNFFTNNSSTRLTITPQGNIGIGTYYPQAKLHLAGTSGIDGIMFPDGTLQTTAAAGVGGFTLPYAGSVEAADDPALSVTNTGEGGEALDGLATAFDGRGVVGRATGPDGCGVEGAAAAPATHGGKFWAEGGPGQIGVEGSTGSASGYGVYGVGGGAGSYGVYGTASSATGYAMYGTMYNGNYGYLGGSLAGAYGRAVTGAYGVFGEATAGSAYGVHGRNNHAAGAGVMGQSDAGTGVTGASASGTGVIGFNQNAGTLGMLGTPQYGVYGEHAAGYAGYFSGDGLFTGNVGIGAAPVGAKLEVAGLLKTTDFQLTTSPMAGHVLTCDAAGVASWQAAGGFTLPYAGSTSTSTNPAFSVTNISTGSAVSGKHDSSGNLGILGGFSAGVIGDSSGPGDAIVATNWGDGDGVRAEAHGNGRAVYAASEGPETSAHLAGPEYGVRADNGVHGTTAHLAGPTHAVYGEHPTGFAGYFAGKGYFSGNVGIGTSTPAAPLDVASTLPRPSIVTRGGADYATVTGQTINIGHWDGTTYTDRLSISSAGAVSIPNNVTVTGTVDAGSLTTDAFRLGTSATAGHVLTADANGNGVWQAPTGGGGGVSGSGTVNYVAKFVGPTSIGNSVLYETGANVGIGDASPDAKLDVQGGLRSSHSHPSLEDAWAEVNYAGANGPGLSMRTLFGVPVERVYRADVRLSGSVLRLLASSDDDDPESTDGIAVHAGGRVTLGDSVAGGRLAVLESALPYAIHAEATAADATGLFASGGTGGNAADFKGRVRVLDPNTNDDLARIGRGTSGGGSLIMRNANSVETIHIDADESEGGGRGGEIIFKNASNHQTVQIDGDAQGDGWMKLYNGVNTRTIELDTSDNDGRSRVTTDVLQLTGGSDVSEQFDIAPADGPPAPGMVVVIDPDRPGQLKLAATPYDRKVAGVISGAGGIQPGMLMGQRDTVADGQHPVALAGRVYVWCDASVGPIAPGDLLTTSATPGHAMRADDVERRSGAILGKAMTGLDEGRGLVLVLVTLQ